MICVQERKRKRKEKKKRFTKNENLHGRIKKN
jgi:hypothetical protein